jgi:hypothetical protein
MAQKSLQSRDRQGAVTEATRLRAARKAPGTHLLLQNEDS